MSSQKQSISVVGLGQMGSKIAELFIKQKYSVIVWNRTIAKSREIQGAIVAETISDAMAAASIIFVCVYDNKAFHEILAGVNDKTLLKNKIVINFTTGTPQEVNELEKFFVSAGAAYLNGALQVAPDQMGLPETTILLAGNTNAFQTSSHEIAVLGGNVQHLGSNASASPAMDLAILSWLYGSYVGMLYGVVLVKQAGLPLNVFGNLLQQVTSGFVEFFKHQINTVENNDFRITQSPLAISITATQRIADAIRDAGGAPAFHDNIAALLKKADASGLGNQELSVLIKVIETN